MREADDMVDDAVDSKQAEEALNQFAQLTDIALRGAPASDEAVWIALSEVAQRTSLDHKPFHDMLRGQLDDVQSTHYESFEDLEQYCHRVASTVGLVCIAIWGYRGPSEKANDLAIKRGVAFQLTNILRDFREDYSIGRVYLPADEFAQHEITPEDFYNWTDGKKCREFIIAQIDRARCFYIESAPLDALINPACQSTLWAMTKIYRQLLEKLAQQPDRLASNRRLRLTALQKSSIALQARLRSSQVIRK